MPRGRIRGSPPSNFDHESSSPSQRRVDHHRSRRLPVRSFERRKRRKKLKPGYDLKQGRLAVTDNAAFLADKLNLLRLFEEGLRTGYLIHPDAMRLVGQLGKVLGQEVKA